MIERRVCRIPIVVRNGYPIEYVIAVVGRSVVYDDDVLNVPASQEYVEVLYQCVIFVESTR